MFINLDRNTAILTTSRFDIETRKLRLSNRLIQLIRNSHVKFDLLGTYSRFPCIIQCFIETVFRDVIPSDARRALLYLNPSQNDRTAAVSHTCALAASTRETITTVLFEIRVIPDYALEWCSAAVKRAMLIPQKNQVRGCCKNSSAKG